MNWNNNFTYTGSSSTKLNISITTTKVDVTKNQTEEQVIVKFVHAGSSYNSTSYTASLNFNGTPRTRSFNYSGAGTITLFNFKQLVTHNSDGTKKVNLSVSDNRYNMPYTGSVSVNATITLDTIPRYTTITSYYLDDATFDSYRVNWATEHTVDQVDYYTSAYGWITAWTGSAKSGSFRITGLQPGNTYSRTIKVWRKDTQLSTQSEPKSITTKQIAKFTSVPNNIDTDQPFTVNFNRNDATTIKIGIADNEGKQYIINPITVTGSSYTFEHGKDNYNKTKLYSHMTTVNSKEFRLYIESNDSLYFYEYIIRTFKITNANPILIDFNYEDINSTTLLLTKDNQRVIQGYSNIETTFSAATAQKGASIKKYTLINGSQTVSSTSVVALKIYNAASPLLELIVEDSRGNTTTITKTLPFIPYSRPMIQNLVFDRKPGTDETTYIIANGIYQNVNFGDVVNNIKKIDYRFKSNGEYSNWNNITLLFASGGGTYHNIIGASLNFIFGTEYIIEFRVHDEITFHIMTAKVSKGLYLAMIDHEYKSIGFGIEARAEENSIAVKGNIYAPNMLGYEIIGDI